jgi:hypothetical protein
MRILLIAVYNLAKMWTAIINVKSWKVAKLVSVPHANVRSGLLVTIDSGIDD